MACRVVLVHGAWHGAWAWERVVALLTAKRIPSTAVELPGHGTDRGPYGDLHSDAERVRDAIDQTDDDVILVGHSYGGAVITEAGTHPRVRHLVYIAAFALEAGESCVSAAMADEGAGRISHEGRPSLGDGFISGIDGLITLDHATAAACFYNDCEADTVAWALARLGPQPLITLQGAPNTVAWRSKPSTYVVCADDLAVHPELQRILARRCDSTVEWQTDHSPFLCRPDLVADLLGNLADE
jgi:pimeloyl-ACP methyl ester carboxylesterase